LNPFFIKENTEYSRNTPKTASLGIGDSRLMKEFDCIENIGNGTLPLDLNKVVSCSSFLGSFGNVYRARLVIDGSFYAIKRLKHVGFSTVNHFRKIIKHLQVLPRASGTNVLNSLLKEIHWYFSAF
jgi:hypothetical protein